MGCHARVLAVAVTVSGGDAACGQGRDRTRDCSSKSARPRVTDGAGEGRRLPTPGGRRLLAGRTPAGQGGPPSPPSFENLVPTVVHFGGSGRCHARYGRRGDGGEDPHTGRLTRSAGSCLKPPRPAGLARAGGAGVELRPGSAAAPVQPPGDPAALHLLMVSGPRKHPHPTPPLPANPWDHQGDLSPPVGHGGLPESLGSGEEAHGQGCKGVTARQRF